MCLNRTSELKVMSIRISRELPLFNFERLDILCAWIVPPSEKLLPFEFLESFLCSILRVSILCAWIWPPCEKLWPIEFLESFRWSISSISLYYAPKSDIRVKSYDHLNFSRASVGQFRVSRYIMYLNRTTEWKVMTIWISRVLPLFNFERLDI